jgi:hypothetical protein
LREYPVDVPWGEVELLAAMVARRRAAVGGPAKAVKEQASVDHV